MDASNIIAEVVLHRPSDARVQSLPPCRHCGCCFCAQTCVVVYEISLMPSEAGVARLPGVAVDKPPVHRPTSSSCRAPPSCRDDERTCSVMTNENESPHGPAHNPLNNTSSTVKNLPGARHHHKQALQPRPAAFFEAKTRLTRRTPTHASPPC